MYLIHVKSVPTTPEWVEDYLDTKRRVSNYEKELLLNGAKNFSQALIIKEIKVRYDKMKGLHRPQPERPNLQSTFKDFNKRISTNST